MNIIIFFSKDCQHISVIQAIEDTVQQAKDEGDDTCDDQLGEIFHDDLDYEDPPIIKAKSWIGPEWMKGQVS